MVSFIMVVLCLCPNCFDLHVHIHVHYQLFLIPAPCRGLCMYRFSYVLRNKCYNYGGYAVMTSSAEMRCVDRGRHALAQAKLPPHVVYT